MEQTTFHTQDLFHASLYKYENVQIWLQYSCYLSELSYRNQSVGVHHATLSPDAI